ncbi:hypothetical protein GPJ56_008178 [Histomonas meleagridis]|uniref:uncharacterized protein n=1 Tax=Histomonas meleagridis TaxID=135588 RepID=UPI00355A6CDE|nr:hypothetical protein GPJ56_008178 [Histomonas meleagridis]KAH0797199.1 hypothetical protein GO595_009881 [Histomonas meleagridis]
MVPESYDDGLFGEWNVIKGEYLDECVSYIPTTSISQSLSSDYNTNSQYMSNSDGNQGSDTDSTGTIAAVVVVVVVVVIGAAVGAFFIIRRRKQKMANDAQNVFEDEPQLEEIEEKEGNGKGDEPNNEVDDLLV